MDHIASYRPSRDDKNDKTTGRAGELVLKVRSILSGNATF